MKMINLIFSWLLVLGLVQCSKEGTQKGSVAIIPYPVTLIKGDGEFKINNKTQIVATDSGAQVVASFLRQLINAASDFKITVSNKSASSNKIEFIIQAGYQPEEYELNVSEEKATIIASTSAGLFYGVQTIRQMLPVDIEKKEMTSAAWTIPVVRIRDQPRYSWRGMHLDVSRHFFSLSFLKRFIDRMVLYKLNKFHLHLTDDQGWRIEINKYPELTTQGAFRKFNDQDSICIMKSLENPDFALPEEFITNTDDGKVYGGFYTQDQIRELVQYASHRFITIVPEIDMPGHMKAALNRYPELSCVDGSGWGKIFSVPLCPCEESTYQFAENILTELTALFPGEYIHIGGDEVDKLTWSKAAACKTLMKKEGIKNVDQLQGYFVKRLEKFLQSKNKKMIGWDEVLEGGVDSTTHIMYWRGWIADAPLKAAREHHQVIMSPTSHCYYDYEPDQTTLEKMYQFEPVPSGFSPREAKQIKGVQANIWTEWIATEARLDYMTMPRMLALAEVAWAKSTSFEDFNNRLIAHYPRLDELKIRYRLPDLPNLQKHVVFLKDAKLNLQKPQGVREIRYTTDGSIPTSSSMLYSEPVSVDETTTFKLLTFGAGGRNGNSYTVHYEKQTYLPAVSPQFTGVNCFYYEGNSWNSVKDTVAAKLTARAKVKEIDIPSFCRNENYGLVFTTYVNVPTEGIYTFFLSSDDGSALQVGDRMVINHDGFHSNQEVNGQIALQKGSHLLKLSYFESSGGNSVSLAMEGPKLSRRRL
jgi:hexosaminidase